MFCMAVCEHGMNRHFRATFYHHRTRNPFFECGSQMYCRVGQTYQSFAVVRKTWKALQTRMFQNYCRCRTFGTSVDTIRTSCSCECGSRKPQMNTSNKRAGRKTTRAQVRRHRVPVGGFVDATLNTAYRIIHKLVVDVDVDVVRVAWMPWDRAVSCGSINVRRSARLSTRHASERLFYARSVCVFECARMWTHIHAWCAHSRRTFRIIHSCVRFGISIEMRVHIMDTSPLYA